MTTYNIESAVTELQRMYHKRMIDFKQYSQQHALLYHMYANFEGENHVVTSKTFADPRQQPHGDRVDSLERRQRDYTLQGRRGYAVESPADAALYQSFRV